MVAMACNGRPPMQSNGESLRKAPVNNLIYIVGLVVIVLAVLSWLGLR